MISFRKDNPGRHLCMLLAFSIMTLISWGTIATWPVASQALTAYGPGPYIPVRYSDRSHTANGGPVFEEKSIEYILPSVSFSTFSTFRVTAADSGVKVEEIHSGLVRVAAGYLVIYLFLFLCIFRIHRQH